MAAFASLDRWLWNLLDNLEVLGNFSCGRFSFYTDYSVLEFCFDLTWNSLNFCVFQWSLRYSGSPFSRVALLLCELCHDEY